MTVKVKLTVSNGNYTVVKNFECKCPNYNYIKSYCPARTQSDQFVNLSGNDKSKSMLSFKNESNDAQKVTEAYLSTFLPEVDSAELNKVKEQIIAVCSACKELIRI